MAGHKAEKKTSLDKSKGKFFYIFFFWPFCVIVFWGIVYAVTSRTLKQEMGAKCLGIASAVAVMLEEHPEEYKAFVASLDTASDYYIRTKAAMERIRYANLDSIVLLYSEVRVSEDMMMYVFDGERADADTFSAPGSQEPITAARRAVYDSRRARVGDFAVGAGGMFMSAYAPIFNRNTGEFLGLVGVDVSIKQYNAIMQKQFAVVIGSSIVMMLMTYAILRLSRAKARSDEESFSKSFFLARMSHEMRTPLNAIVGFSEMEMRNDLPQNTRDNLEKIHKAGSNLLGIINDILDISKIESGNFELAVTKYSVSSLINDAVQFNIMRIGSKPIAFDMSLDKATPSVLYGDEIRVKQILNNLLSNAFKYTKEGRVSFKLEWKRQDRQGSAVLLIFTVSDTGSGIAKENIDKLFLEYYRVDNRANRNIEGTGLGLSITKNLAEMMGGSITVESEYGKGSTFTATVRQAVADWTPADFSGKGDHGGKIEVKPRALFTVPGFRVLIVDDIATNLSVASGLLSRFQMEITTCLGGHEAVELARKREFDMIFIDHMMPEMDGIETAKIIRGISWWYYKVPFIALTANAMAGIREMFLENGFDDYLSKPIEVIKLYEIMERWIPPEARAAISADSPPVSAVSPADSDALEIEGIDAELGLKRIGGSMKDYLDVLEIYSRDVESSLSILENIPWENIDNYTIRVHALKSASANIGAVALSNEAAFLEEAGKKGDLQTIWEKTDIFRERLVNLVSGIRKALSLVYGADKGAEETGDAPAADDLLRLKEAIGSRNIGAIDMTLDELSAMPLSDNTKKMLSRVSNHILLADFDEAEDIADALLKEAGL
jgi:signal transduction histidine kinase/HPt (histidine-containing phosphotransfer) domain-containing protein/ActR/RegA family two-component response regulator